MTETTKVEKIPCFKVGRLGSDFVLRFTPSGLPVANASMAVDVPGPEGDWKDKTTKWYDVTCWRELAEHVAESLSKGDLIMVEGNGHQREWTNALGEPMISNDIDANHCGPSLRFTTCEVIKAERPIKTSTPSNDTF